ncbi:MAG: HEAT repeat domain-containing protein, partial [Myxococcales bacterium]|nr:HEAT repeat domain-containing protein [Myxococcales bacterium]
MLFTLRRRRKSRLLRDRARAPGWAWVAVGGWLGLMGPGCGGSGSREAVPNPTPKATPQAAEGAPAEPKAPLDDDAAADRYLEIKTKFEADPAVVQGAEWPGVKAGLEEIANGAGAKPMRANAALLLGAMLEVRGEAAAAIGFYEHAATLVPDDAGPFMALAVAHATAGSFGEAVKAQEDAARLDPDNLENWLALGELRMRAGDESGSLQAYLAYEKRRKGIIDGLTLHDDQGTYVVPPAERIGCAEALAAAADQGTAVALIYALRTDPEPTVRAAVAQVMGTHRLELYLPVLQTQATEESDPDAKEAVAWALAQIAQDPVKIEPTERARLAEDDPRLAEGEVPRAEEAPEPLTEASTLAPASADGAGAGAGAGADEGASAGAGAG